MSTADNFLRDMRDHIQETHGGDASAMCDYAGEWNEHVAAYLADLDATPAEPTESTICDFCGHPYGAHGADGILEHAFLWPDTPTASAGSEAETLAVLRSFHHVAHGCEPEDCEVIPACKARYVFQRAALTSTPAPADAALAKQLAPYASHFGNCDLDSWKEGKSCDCGLYQLLAALGSEQGGDQ